MSRYINATKVLVLEDNIMSQTSGGIQYVKGTTFVLGEDGQLYIHRALDDYGVAVDPSTWALDAEGCTRLWRDHWRHFADPRSLQDIHMFGTALHAPVRDVASNVVSGNLLEAARL